MAVRSKRHTETAVFGGARRCRALVVLVLAIGVAAGPLAASALAQDPDAPPADPIDATATATVFLEELTSVDLDGDGVADFTLDENGFPQIPVGEPGDLDLRPGDGFFGAQVTQQLADAINAQNGLTGAVAIDPGVAIEDDSMLLFNCSGMAMSFDGDGNMIDWAIGIGSREGGGPTGQVLDLFPAEDAGQRVFTQSNPFVVQERVVYFGRLPTEGDGPRNHMWSTETGGVSIDSGGDDNPNGNNRNAGEVDLSDDTPMGGFLIPAGLYPFEGALKSENGLRCEGQGWVEFDTGIVNVATAAATALGLAGVFGLLFNARPAVTWRSP